MKKEKLLRAMELTDDEFVEEANPIRAKAAGKRRRRRAWFGGIVAAAAAAAALWLFIPFNTNPPSVRKYAGSEYYELIQKLNEITYIKPQDKNNFEKYVTNAVENLFNYGAKNDESMAEAPSNSSGFDGSAANYEEITDNQVAGVIEADLIKRSDRYIYYLCDGTLHVYSIEGEASEEVGSYEIANDKMLFTYEEEWEFYLSEDCSTVTVAAAFANEERESCVGLIALDVTDPANITEKGMITVTGGYLSSRCTDGSILLMTQFRVSSDPDFSDESSFLPRIDTGNGMETIPMEDIITPEKLTNSRYAVVCKVDAKSLELIDCAAFLSFSENFYVSENTVFATRTISNTKEEETETGKCSSSWSETEITGLSYSGEKMELTGSIVLDGYIKDQYSLDEYEGILRVVTSSNLRQWRENKMTGESVLEVSVRNGNNANLYCVSLSDWQITASVINFAPEGENVQSVRFDGDVAYVCTAVQLSDPVFFFDLSDINNITYKESETITGYSTSLINFGDGFLMGIGVGSGWDTLKLEVYEETQTGVVSVCQYELDNVNYSDDYKSYYVDRENQLVGLGYDQYGSYSGAGAQERYLLVFFDGYELRVLLDETLAGVPEFKRAVYIDGYFYMFGENDFSVEKIGG